MTVFIVLLHLGNKRYVLLKYLSSFSTIRLIFLRSVNSVETHADNIPSDDTVTVLNGLCVYTECAKGQCNEQESSQVL